MKMLQDSDFTTMKFKEEKLSLQAAISNGQYSFESLLNMMTNSAYKEKASWVMSGVVECNPEFLGAKEVGFLLTLLANKVSKGVERNIWRAFEFIKIPTVHREHCTHLAFEALENKESSIAVQVFAMSVAFELSKNNEDLRHLLKEILLFKMETASKGFQSRANKILRDLI